jgi:chromosome segregation ATPase
VRWWKDHIHAAHREAGDARARSLTSARRLLDVEEKIAHSKAQIFALEQALDERADELGRLRGDMDLLEREREQARSDSEQATRAQERASYILEAMKHSVSWRLTAPLRALKRIFVR